MASNGIGLNGALWLGYSGLQTAQQQINTAGHNLANVDTPGASRQTVSVSQDATVNIGGQNLSIGVFALGITGTRSQYLDAQVQTENSNLGAATTSENYLTEIQNALQEALNSTQTDGSQSVSQTGVLAATSNLYNAWTKLAADPTDSSLRDAVSSAALAFTTTAGSVYNQMLATKQGAFTTANADVSTVNGLMTGIASLNQQIASAEVGSQRVNGLPINQANDLRDQREELIEQLSSMVNVSVTQDATNPSMVDVALTDSAQASATSASSSAFTSGTLASQGYTVPSTITVNGTNVTVNAGDTISDVASNINAASLNGVTASVVNGQLVVKSTSATLSVTGAFGTAAGMTQLGADSSHVFDSTSMAAQFGSSFSGGSFNVNGTGINVVSTDTISDVATKINAAGITGVTAVVVGGRLQIQSATPVTISAGTSNFTTLSGLATVPATTTPVYLVKGTSAGGQNVQGGPDTGTYSLSVAGSSNNVSGYGANQSLTYVASNSANSVVVSPTGGSLGGLLTFDQTVGYEDQTSFAGGRTLLDQFNTFINSVVNSVNGSVSVGYDLNGAASTTHPNGGSFFYNSTTGAASTGAWDLSLNSIYNYTNTAYNSDYIPAASSPLPNGGTSADGSMAAVIGNKLNDQDIYPDYSAFVSDVGSLAQAASTNASAQQLASTQANNSQQSYSGISTDEEMTNLVAFQQAFEASSRFINTINQMYQTLTTSLGT